MKKLRELKKDIARMKTDRARAMQLGIHGEEPEGRVRCAREEAAKKAKKEAR